MKVFGDTSAFYALLDADDIEYQNAHTQWRTLTRSSGFQIVSSAYVVIETCTLLQHRLGMRVVRGFLENILPFVELLTIGDEDYDATLALLLTVGRDGPSPVDCSSFILMEHTGIRKAFAFDKHFDARGFTYNPNQS